MIDLVDDTFVAAPPEQVARAVADPRRWVRWWPDLALTTTRDRGAKGRQWRVDGGLRGTSEIWLEPWRDGVLVHFYLRADPGDQSATGARVDRERRHRAQQWKRAVHALKDDLERGREPGEPVRSTPADLKHSAETTDIQADE
ncbi:hypothetical protein GCM10023145_26670 [Angustibacter luteus]